MSKVAHGYVLVSQNNAEMYCGQSSSWSVFLVVVVSRCGQSFFVVSFLVRRVWLGKTAVNVWTNVRGHNTCR